MGVEESSVVDCSVGTIVWVRRRNGSWWPGRILGSDELSASHLMSPRSGTPVKLLGRDDASVDWYNLEKSKRVKAFRCGEFDACIERAEASLGIPIKKREKYARREDAILHALELEKQQLEMKHRSLGTSYNSLNNRNSGYQRRELHSFSSDFCMADDGPRGHSKFANHISQMLPRKAPSSGEKVGKADTSYAYKGKTSKRSGWEESNNEYVPRMRGLQDFGLRMSPPKKKFSQSFTWEVSCKRAYVHVDALSNVECMLGDVSRPNSSKSSLAIKRKRSQDGNSEDSLVKKCDRRQPLVQVLQSSAKVPTSHSFQSENDSVDISMQGEDHMGVTSRAKRSSCVDLPADSIDSLDNNGYPCEVMPFTATQVGTVPFAEQFSSSELAEETESDSSETDSLEPDIGEDGNLTDTTQMLVPLSENKECPVIQLSDYFRDPINDVMALPNYVMDTSADARVSNWPMKGKRNIRNLTKRPFDSMDGNASIRGSNFKTRRMGFSGNSSQLMGYYNSGRYPFGLEGNKDSDDDSPSSRMPRRSYWDESDECLDLDDEMGPAVLVDVDVQVQKRSYQREHVPWVSLSSKWNGGKPILGHPVQIELLEDGSTRHLVSRYGLGLDEIYDAPPAFTRTAKRSVMHRIPRSMDAADPFDSDQETKPPHKRAYTSYSKRGVHLKRVGMPTKRMRTLSSFATDKKPSERNGIFDGFINPEGGIPVITCVPVKVAFSRILEAVGRSRCLLQF